MFLRSAAPALNLIAFAALWSGCVGFSRQESKALFPADSLSRAAAEAIPVDTMAAVWVRDTLSLSDGSSWQYVASLRFGTDARLVAADVGQAAMYTFDSRGRLARTTTLPQGAFPYLLSAEADTLVVFDPASGRVAWIVGGALADTLALAPAPESDALGAFAAYESGRLALKILDQPVSARISAFEPPGYEPGRSVDLPGQSWRYRGPLRWSGDSLLSISAFLPVLHVWTPAGLDTLRLFGFDSPVLNKTRLFVLGERDDPPLLAASVAAAGEYLFVLNVRPGWIRVDVYDRSGMLRRVLVEPDPEVSDYNVQDIDVRILPDGDYELAVSSVAARYGLASLSYAPRVAVFRWSPGARATRHADDE